MPKAVRATKKSLNYIINYGKLLQFDLRYIADMVEYPEFPEYDIFVITDGSPGNNNVTFTTMIAPDFFANWRFTEQERRYFRPIERV